MTKPRSGFWQIVYERLGAKSHQIPLLWPLAPGHRDASIAIGMEPFRALPVEKTDVCLGIFTVIPEISASLGFGRVMNHQPNNNRPACARVLLAMPHAGKG